MIDRINLILRAKNITARQFAEEIGIQPSGMSHILGGRNNPSLDFVTKVIRRYPEIDANWLLLGRGEMYAGAAPASADRVPAPDAATEPSLFDGVDSEPHGLVAAEPSVDPHIVESIRQIASQTESPYSTADAEAGADAARYEPSYVAVPPASVAAPGQPSESPAPSAPPQPQAAAPKADTDRKLVSMLLIYSDNTFEEFRPR